MGKPAAPVAKAATAASSYRDDPDAVSLHTTRSDYDYDDVPELPAYSDSVAATGHARDPDTAPVDEFHPISHPPAITSGWRKVQQAHPSAALGAETSIRMDAALMHADHLHAYITNYLRVVPPSPAIRVQGWHWQTTRRDNKKHQERVVDFDLVFGLQRYLAPGCDPVWWEPRVAGNSTKTYRGSWRQTRAPGFTQDVELAGDDAAATPALRDVCAAFADSPARVKVFRVARTVTGLDTARLEAQIVHLVRATHYRGHVDVTFPVADRNVDIYSPHWANRARLSWVRWLFYLSFLWLLTWPVLVFWTRRWAVYAVEWRFSIPDPAAGSSRRRYAVLGEDAWLARHANLIRSLALEKFAGDATHLPTDIAPPEGRRGALRRGSAPATGNRTVDRAFGAIQGGVDVWNAMSRGAEGEGWGADERQ